MIAVPRQANAGSSWTWMAPPLSNTTANPRRISRLSLTTWFVGYIAPLNGLLTIMQGTLPFMACELLVPNSAAPHAPWHDLESLLRQHDVPLFSVDAHLPASAFDLLAFNLSAELVFTNVLNMVDLAGAHVRSADRRADDLLVVIGGQN